MAEHDTARKGIAVGIDGSKDSEYALEWALARAHVLACPVTLLTIVDSAVANKCGVDAQALVDSVSNQQLELKSQYQKLFPDVEVQTLVKLGKFIKTLVSVGGQFDMLVLGKAENTVESLIGGSPAVRFSGASDTPCVVVPQSWVQAQDPASNCIVVGVGPDLDVSGPAIMFAAQEADRMNASLLLVSSWGLPAWLEKTAGVMGGGASAAGHERSFELTVIAGRLRQHFPNLKIQTHCIEGSSTTNALRDMSEGASMLVLGTNGRNMLGRALYGSPTYEALLKPQVPVVVVPPSYGVKSGLYTPGEFSLEQSAGNAVSSSASAVAAS